MPKTAIYSRKSGALGLIVCLLFVLSLSARWHHLNVELPTSDAAAYLTDAYRLYHIFVDEGILGGIRGLYMERGWRPQIFPIFSAPVLMLFGPNPFNVTVGVSLTFFAVLIIYVFLNIKETTSTTVAIVCTIFICTYPPIFDYSLKFFSEIGYLPMAVATIYHLRKSEYFEHFGHSFWAGVYMAMVACFRPAESILFALALTPFLVVGFQHKTFNLGDVTKCFLIAFATVVFLFHATYVIDSTKIRYLFGFIFILYLALSIKKARSSKAPPLHAFVLITCLMIFAFWLPAVDKLINWSIEASSGSVVKSLGDLGSLGFIQFFEQFTWMYKALFIPILISAGLIIIVQRRDFSFEKDNIVLFVALILPLIFLILSYVLSVNDNQLARRTVGVAVLFAVFISSIIKTSLVRHSLVVLLPIVLLTISNVSLILNSMSNAAELTFGRTIYQQIGFPAPYSKRAVIGKESRHISLANEIEKRVCSYDPKPCFSNYRGFFVTEPVNYAFSNFIDPFSAALTVSVIRRNATKFGFGFVFVPSDKDVMTTLNERYIHYILVQDSKEITDDMLDSAVSHSQKFTASMLRQYRKGSYKGVSLIDEFDLQDTKILIFRNESVAF